MAQNLPISRYHRKEREGELNLYYFPYMKFSVEPAWISLMKPYLQNLREVYIIRSLVTLITITKTYTMP